jgi:dTDP-4-dehydrorhamnose reductase
VRALIAGSSGQLGRALQANAPADVTIIAPREADFDITDPDVVRAIVADVRPDIIINAAAYTAVDKAEGDEATARLVNVNAVRTISGCA